MNGWNLGVDRRKRRRRVGRKRTETTETRVTLDDVVCKGGTGRRYRVYSSVIEGRPLHPGDWADGVADRVNKRLSNNEGGNKGRVFYVGRAVGVDERVPLAVAAWHLPPDDAADEPLELLDLDVANAVWHEHPEFVGLFARTLLDALHATARHPKVGRPDDRLAWIADERAVAERAYGEWGFNVLRGSAHPAHNKTKWYSLRVEP